MAYDSARGLIVAGTHTPALRRVFDPADPKNAAVNIGSDDSTPGVNTDSGYPGYTRASGSFVTDGFAVGHHVRVIGAAADVNGSTAAPKVWRIAYLTATTMGVEGPGSSSMTTVGAASGITIRRVRLFRALDFRSVAALVVPLWLQATTITNLSGTAVHGSSDAGVTWEALPEVALPDTAHSNALLMQYFGGVDSLMQLVPAASYAGYVYVN